MSAAKSNRIIVTVIGADTVGIIANVSAVLAAAHANIIDISQTTVREFFAMIMMADLEKATIPFDELKRRLDAKGAEMGLRIDAQHEDVFKFMHRVCAANHHHMARTRGRRMATTARLAMSLLAGISVAGRTAAAETC